MIDPTFVGGGPSPRPVGPVPRPYVPAGAPPSRTWAYVVVALVLWLTTVGALVYWLRPGPAPTPGPTPTPPPVDRLAEATVQYVRDLPAAYHATATKLRNRQLPKATAVYEDLHTHAKPLSDEIAAALKPFIDEAGSIPAEQSGAAAAVLDRVGDDVATALRRGGR